MNESAEYTRLLAQAYSKLADDYAAIWKREDAARAEIQRLEELLEKWMAEATRQCERADAAEACLRASCDDEHKHFVEATEWKLRAEAAEARVKELEADNTRGAAYVQHLTAQLTARQQGGAK